MLKARMQLGNRLVVAALLFDTQGAQHLFDFLQGRFDIAEQHGIGQGTLAVAERNDAVDRRTIGGEGLAGVLKNGDLLVVAKIIGLRLERLVQGIKAGGQAFLELSKQGVVRRVDDRKQGQLKRLQLGIEVGCGQRTGNGAAGHGGHVMRHAARLILRETANDEHGEKAQAEEKENAMLDAHETVSSRNAGIAPATAGVEQARVTAALNDTAAQQKRNRQGFRRLRPEKSRHQDDAGHRASSGAGAVHAQPA
jgi:hypothetical protein